MRSFVIGLLVFSAAIIHAVPFATSDPRQKPGDTFTTEVQREQHALGLKRTPESQRFIKQAKHFHLKALRGDTSVPKAFDFGNKVSPPENQGGCGSCWDFSLTKALRSALMLAGKDPGTLAFNYLLNNCGPGPRMYGCNGGDFDAGKSFLNSKGPWLEKDDPYGEREGRCKDLSAAGTALSMEFVGNEAPSFQELAYAMSQGHMLSVDVAVQGAWGSYSGGIYNRNDGSPGGINHMINMTGYNCETSVEGDKCKFDSSGKPVNKDGYLIAQNNWGDWGENGFMRTRWGMNAIAYTAAYFVVKDAPPPVPAATCSLAASPSKVKVGDEVSLIIMGTNASKASIDGVDVSPLNGSRKVRPIAEGHYTASGIVVGDGGQGFCQVSYEVTSAPIPPTPSGGIPVWMWIILAVLSVVTVGSLIYVFFEKKPKDGK